MYVCLLFVLWTIKIVLLQWSGFFYTLLVLQTTVSAMRNDEEPLPDRLDLSLKKIYVYKWYVALWHRFHLCDHGIAFCCYSSFVFAKTPQKMIKFWIRMENNRLYLFAWKLALGFLLTAPLSVKVVWQMLLFPASLPALKNYQLYLHFYTM